MYTNVCDNLLINIFVVNKAVKWSKKFSKCFLDAQRIHNVYQHVKGSEKFCNKKEKRKKKETCLT